MAHPVHRSPFETAKVKRRGLEKHTCIARERDIKLKGGYAFALRVEGGRKRSH
jgi:hypothetical protein